MLDNKDQKIIDILSVSGREPASNISAEIGLSVPAVIDRINKLQESDIIQGFKAVINYKKLGMDVLIEAHTENEIERAINLDADLIGINNRNLKTLEIDIYNSIKLSKLIPKKYDIICESGLNTNNDLKIMEKNGIMRFLVGESLMKKENIEEATKKLINKN